VSLSPQHLELAQRVAVEQLARELQARTASSRYSRRCWQVGEFPTAAARRGATARRSLPMFVRRIADGDDLGAGGDRSPRASARKSRYLPVPTSSASDRRGPAMTSGSPVTGLRQVRSFRDFTPVGRHVGRAPSVAGRRGDYPPPTAATISTRSPFEHRCVAVAALGHDLSPLRSTAIPLPSRPSARHHAATFACCGVERAGVP
jgi:hypothetical protein